MILAALCAAASIVISVSFAIIDTDVWQHLAVGRAIWSLPGVPTNQVWTWPTFGTPDVTPSWGFRALIWPVWSAVGVVGLFAWRWVTTLAAFGIAWATARRLGARGVTPVLVAALAALVYRQRSQVRPETLVAVLIALQIGLLEARRARAPSTEFDPAWWGIPLAWIWANVHISYWIGLVLIAIYWLDDVVAARRAGRDPHERRPPRTLAAVGLAAAAISFLNPSGWRALAQPFEYALIWSREPIFRDIGELWPVQWQANLINGLPLLVGGWPLLWLWRARRQRPDLAEGLLLVFVTTLGLTSQRFLGLYALVATPFVARGLSEWLGARAWPARLARPWSRASLAAAACLTIGIPEWSRPELALGVAIDPREYPERACDAIDRHDVRGRGFNLFPTGGYQLFRFWPDRDRLPFMDIHQAGTPEIRREYMEAVQRPGGFAELDRRFGFDYVLAWRRPLGGGLLLDALDGDTTFAAVFVDDAAALLVRRAGRYADLAAREGYRLLPVGPEARAALRNACARDPALRAAVARELERQVAASPWTASAHDLLGELEAFSDRLESARGHFETAVAADPLMVGPNERLGVVELLLGRPDRALRAFERERRVRGSAVGLDLRFGQAYRGLGRVGPARAAFRRELERGPWKQEASDSLAALDRIGSR